MTEESEVSKINALQAAWSRLAAKLAEQKFDFIELIEAQKAVDGLCAKTEEYRKMLDWICKNNIWIQGRIDIGWFVMKHGKRLAGPCPTAKEAIEIAMEQK